MSAADPSLGERRARIALIDVLRGGALAAMAVYHFTWDLGFFGYAEPALSQTGPMKWFARGIASTFLILAGFSLVLAHGGGIRWRAFLRRFAVVAGAALLVSAGTYVAMPKDFIFFGILHQIAAGSLIGLAFLYLPPLLSLAAAAAMIAAPHFLRSAVFDAPLLWWIGLSSLDPRSNDFVPILPWTGLIVAGVALARLAERLGALKKPGQAAAPTAPPARALSFLGRRSLAFYLIHQPVLLALLYLFSLAYPAPPPDAGAAYQRACMENCALSQTQPFCAAFCPCVKSRLETAGQFDKLLSGALDPKTDPVVLESAGICSAEVSENGK